VLPRVYVGECVGANLAMAVKLEFLTKVQQVFTSSESMAAYSVEWVRSQQIWNNLRIKDVSPSVSALSGTIRQATRSVHQVEHKTTVQFGKTMFAAWS
jgi:hypothetical protein